MASSRGHSAGGGCGIRRDRIGGTAMRSRQHRTAAIAADPPTVINQRWLLIPTILGAKFVGMARVLEVGLFAACDLSERDYARLLAPKLKALADETRLALILHLSDRPHTVRELQEKTGLGQTLVSHHLGLLREQGLVSATAHGRSNTYALCCDQLAEPVRVLATLAALTPVGVAACCDPGTLGSGDPLP